MKRIGPSTDPWGTPKGKGAGPHMNIQNVFAPYSELVPDCDSLNTLILNSFLNWLQSLVRPKSSRQLARWYGLRLQVWTTATQQSCAHQCVQFKLHSPSWKHYWIYQRSRGTRYSDYYQFKQLNFRKMTISPTNKKHSENADTSTSVTFDMWCWPYDKVKNAEVI